MNQVIPFPVRVEKADATASARQTTPAVRTDTVYVLFTSLNDTLAAARAAQPFADAVGVPVTIVHVRAVPFALPVDEPTGISPVETERFMEQLQAAGVNARVRVYLCRDTRRAIPFAFARHSLIVIGGRHKRWPTRAERWRRTLEDAGHFVMFADTCNSSIRREVRPSSHADQPREACCA